MLRTHDAGSLNASLVGQTVTLAGWVARRRDHGGVAFLDLRDASGIAQVVVHDEATFSPLRNEFVVKVTGEVKARPEGSENPNLASGEIEVHADSLEVLNASAALPFQVDEHVEVGEETRLQYRYLDLRRPKPAANLRLRSEANKAARRVLEERNFLEVETPTMTRSTPEGARDFIVPARLAPGKWYALPQSPQLFKQLLQVGGVERYYQLARCYRDEDFRADRQPEFTQLDIEASFVDQEDIIALGEAIVKELWKLIGVEIETPIRRMTYQEAMTKYGSDKPDLRFDNPITELKEFFKDTEFRVFQQEYVGAVVMPGGASQPRRQLDGWQEWAKQHGGKGLAYVLVQEDGELTGPVAKNLTDFERENLAETVGAKPGDCIFFGAGPTNSTRQLLGQARVEIAHRTGMIKDGDWAFVWVVDAPMFMSTAEAVADGDVAVGDGKWTAVHHAFTAPKPEFLDTFDTDPGSALTNAYDIVCNGNEIGGGSIRIHRRDVQERVFKIMGVDEKTQQEQFGFLLEGFKYGAPPHGGIAFGWDRVVSLLAGETSIREVIAFPKTGGGFDPLTAAPAEITPQQRKEAGVDAKPAEQKKDGNAKKDAEKNGAAK
ncbi:aspartate--tRNA ligase [Pseudoglutamicibacter cumminsii]|uniref:aspartate--tRNA ligase n=1 Tax=Pseudoglutamicibacter cumminsii TaxID=156979 RepID=UPI0019572C5F|nr:aspartyl-tRNA synthetase [Pseudoglutamicibacter cumminsii]